MMLKRTIVKMPPHDQKLEDSNRYLLQCKLMGMTAFTAKSFKKACLDAFNIDVHFEENPKFSYNYMKVVIQRPKSTKEDEHTCLIEWHEDPVLKRGYVSVGNFCFGGRKVIQMESYFKDLINKYGHKVLL